MEGIFSICFRTGIIPMKYWKRGLKEMSDKTILEQWRAIAYDQQADRNKLQRFWANYFNIEKGIMPVRKHMENIPSTSFIIISSFS